MTPDWNAPAKLLSRDDGGSEMYFEFTELGHGTLAEMVARVTPMSGDARARLLIDAGAQGTLNVGEILALAARDDFPA